jgi:hypothetical protein
LLLLPLRVELSLENLSLLHTSKSSVVVAVGWNGMEWNGEEALSGREGVYKWSGNLWRELELVNADR